MRRTITALAVLCLGSGTAVADPINLTAVTTIDGALLVVDIDRTVFFGDFSHSTDSLGPVTLSDAVGSDLRKASATITSVTKPAGFQVSASTTAAAYGPGSGDDPAHFAAEMRARADATYQASFTLTQPYLFVSTLTSPSGAFETGCNASLINDTLQSVSCLHPGVVSGTLSPGAYRFSLDGFFGASAFGTAIVASDQQFDAAFALTPVAATPEPVSLLLLGTGLAAVWQSHRFRRVN